MSPNIFGKFLIHKIISRYREKYKTIPFFVNFPFLFTEINTGDSCLHISNTDKEFKK